MIEATGLMIGKLLLWLKSKLTGDDPRHWRLELHDTGFRCFARKRCDEVRWSEVQSIRTYKRDIWVHDLICVLFETKSGALIEIDEKMKGFGAVVTRFEKVFKKIPADWLSTVMFPAFEPKERVLWQSQSNDPDAEKADD